jgi:PKD repeat protein
MIKPGQEIKLSVWDKDTEDFVDITNGVLSIDFKSGSDSFEGFWDQPDTGQFVITTRGDTADPNLNSLITTNAFLQISRGNPNEFDTGLYYGFITDVNVKYNKRDKQIVTINGTDVIGFLNRLLITQEFIDTIVLPTYPDALMPVADLIFYAPYFLQDIVKNFFYFAYNRAETNITYFEFGPMSATPPSPLVKVEEGKTFYELMSSGTTSGLIRYESNKGNDYIFYPNFKYDSSFYDDRLDVIWANDKMLVFKTNQDDPTQYDFEEGYLPFIAFSTFSQINISNGLDRMINNVVINNTNPVDDTTFTSPTYVSDENVLNFGPAKLDLGTKFSEERNSFWLDSSTIAAQAEEISTEIIKWQAAPETIIDSITVNMVQTDAVIAKNGDRVFVQHRLNDDTYIFGFYVVCGVQQQITESDWFITYILRKSEYDYVKNNRGKFPEIDLNLYEGTTATTFTASIGNYTTEDFDNVESIEWMVNVPFIDSLNNRPVTNKPSEKFNNVEGLGVPIFTGDTVTWTYDDGGVLEDYYWPEFGLMLNGPGFWGVAVWVKFKNGITTNNYSVVEISSATAFADFGFNKDAQERVTFYDASGADTNTWEWDFGDGTTYSGKNPPVKQYATAGTYNVRLDVDNGFTTDHIIKPVTINIYQIPVQYIKLRYQGTVTRPAGETEYPVDLIDTIGLLEVINTSNEQLGGIQPFYFGRIGTLEKVQELSKGNGFQFLRILDDPITKANHQEWIYQSSPLNPADPVTPYGPWGPNFTTNYSSGGPLDPMSQTMLNVWTDNPTRGTVCGTVPKYRFIPVITDNEDGSQTKSIDIDINFWYSQTYITGTKTSSSSSVYRNYRNNQAAGANIGGIVGPNAEAYLPGGRLASLAYWPQWGSGVGSSYNQSLKIKEVNIWPGMDTKVKKTTAKQNVTIGTNTFIMFDPPVDPPLDRFGVQSGKTYLPIEIAVSPDGVNFHKIGEAEYVSGNTLTTTYTTSMPPFSDAPILT